MQGHDFCLFASHNLEDVSEDLASNVFPTGLLVVHDTGRGGQDDDTERTGRHESVYPVLDLVKGDVESGGNDTTLVDSAIELDDDFAGTVVINVLEFVNVTMFLHDSQETDDDFGAGSDQDLALSSPFGIEYVV